MKQARIKVTDRPDLYDWLYEEYTGDIPMYRSLAESHAEVLECGIGTGRVAIPLANSGRIVFGIDNSPAMLQRLEGKLKEQPPAIRDSIHWYRADMRDFDLGRKFSFIYAPFSTFNYLLTIEDQKASLAAIRRHITAQGTLVLEILSFSLYPKWLDNEPVMRLVKEKTDPKTGKTVAMWKFGKFDSATQIVTEERHFRFYDATGKFEREETVFWENRFFFLGEMRLLLEASGFKTVAVYGDYSFGPYRHTSKFAVVVAKPI